MSTTEVLSLRERLIPSVEVILGRDVTLHEKLFAICELLEDEVENFDWVGFYMAEPSGKQELILGPFVGEATDHTHIPFGTGICGQVAVSHQTYVSQDVHAEENYLACSVDVQSEIVVPILKGNVFVAQLDIDSNQKNAITTEKRELVEEICALLSSEF